MALDVFSSVRGLLKPEEIIIDNFVFQVMHKNFLTWTDLLNCLACRVAWLIK